MNTNELNKFDQLLKSKIENHKEVFNAGDWSKLEEKLPSSSPKSIWSNPWLWSGAAAIAIIATVLCINNNLKNESQVEQKSPERNTPSTELSLIEKDNDHSYSKDVDLDLNENVDNLKVNPLESEKPLSNQKIIKPETTASKNPDTDVNPTATVKPDNETKVNLSPTVTPEDFAIAISVEKPVAHIFCKSTEQCVNSKFIFETTSQNDVDYLWDFGDENYSKEQNPTHKFSEPGSYKVSLIVRSKIDNTVLTKAKEVLITVQEAPKVNFETEVIVSNGIPTHSFINTTDRAISWSWNLGDGNISNDKDPYHNFKRKGYYNVSLTAINEEGCSKTHTRKIYGENDYNLLAPNSFTPNGDGINDFFIPEALKVMDVEFSMSIFSQTDGLLFETKSNNIPWDGINNQNGEKCANGNYIWIVTLTNAQGKIEQYKGAVLILE